MINPKNLDLLLDDFYNFGVRTEQERCLKILDLSTSELLLLAGEMTAQELRTVRAVLKYLSEKIKNG